MDACAAGAAAGTDALVAWTLLAWPAGCAGTAMTEEKAVSLRGRPAGCAGASRPSAAGEEKVVSLRARPAGCAGAPRPSAAGEEKAVSLRGRPVGCWGAGAVCCCGVYVPFFDAALIPLSTSLLRTPISAPDSTHPALIAWVMGTVRLLKSSWLPEKPAAWKTLSRDALSNFFSISHAAWIFPDKNLDSAKLSFANCL